MRRERIQIIWRSLAGERTRRAGATAIATILAQSVGKLSAFISVPLTLSYLGPEQYGLWLTVSSMIGWLSLADLGLGCGLLTRLAAAYGTRNVVLQRQLVTSTLAAQAAIAILLIAVCAALFPFLNWQRLFNVTNPDTVVILPAIIVIVFVAFILQFVFSVTTQVYRALQEGYTVQGWSTIASVCGLIAIVLITKVHGGVTVLVATLAGAPAMALVGNTIWMYARGKPHLRPRVVDISWRAIKSVAGLGIQYSGLALCAVAVSQTPNVIIAQYFGLAQVAPYGVAMKLYALAQAAGIAMLAPLWPAYTEAIVSADHTWIRRTHVRMVWTNALMWGAFGVMFVLGGPLGIRLWVGPGVTSSRALLAGIALQGFFAAEAMVYTTLLNGAGVVRQQFAVVVTPAVMTVALMLVMGARWGSEGIVWAGAAGTGVTLLLLWRVTPVLTGGLLATRTNRAVGAESQIETPSPYSS